MPASDSMSERDVPLFVSLLIFITPRSPRSTIYFLFVHCLLDVFCLFFFSGRRRHTRCLIDWSSDVCSSDLEFLGMCEGVKEGAGTLLDHSLFLATSDSCEARIHSIDSLPIMVAGTAGGKWKSGTHINGKEIGRASCREREKVEGVEVGAKRT